MTSLARTTIPLDAAYAQLLDAADPLSSFRERFHIPEDQIYLDGRVE